MHTCMDSNRKKRRSYPPRHLLLLLLQITPAAAWVHLKAATSLKSSPKVLMMMLTLMSISKQAGQTQIQIQSLLAQLRLLHHRRRRQCMLRLQSRIQSQ